MLTSTFFFFFALMFTALMMNVTLVMFIALMVTIALVMSWFMCFTFFSRFSGHIWLSRMSSSFVRLFWMCTRMGIIGMSAVIRFMIISRSWFRVSRFVTNVCKVFARVFGRMFARVFTRMFCRVFAWMFGRVFSRVFAWMFRRMFGRLCFWFSYRMCLWMNITIRRMCCFNFNVRMCFVGGFCKLWSGLSVVSTSFELFFCFFSCFLSSFPFVSLFLRSRNRWLISFSSFSFNNSLFNKKSLNWMSTCFYNPKAWIYLKYFLVLSRIHLFNNKKEFMNSLIDSFWLKVPEK